MMNYKVRRMFLVAVLFLTAGADLWSQTKEQLHQSNPNFEKDHVQAQGDWPSKKGFIETYTANETIASDGAHFNWLFNYITAGTFFYFILVIIGVLYFSLAYRQRQGRRAYYTDGHAEKKYTLIFDILFFITLDCVLIYYSVVDTRKYFMEPPSGKDVVRVQVMPQQWVWNFRYVGNDGEFGTADDVITVNEMWVPKGKTVSMQMKSKDVIHGFMVAEIRRQMDAIPGTVSRMWFEPIRTGDFEIACMHLCGTAHYKMKGFLKVVEQDDFENWSKEMSEWSEARYDPNDPATHWGWNWSL